jgi:hypothetical protein
MGKIWQWTGLNGKVITVNRFKWERCGSGQYLNGKDITVNRVKWERFGSGQDPNGIDITVDRVKWEDLAVDRV